MTPDGPGTVRTSPAHERGGTVRFLGRHPFISGFVGLAMLLAVALPMVAFVIVPAFVRSTVVEDYPASENASGKATVETVRQGELVRINAADYGSGTVRIVKVGTERFLRFQDVEIAAAPDVYVYLSDQTDGRPGTYIDLGRLKATNGSFNYAIPVGVDLATVRSVVVWCRQFSVTVTYAPLG